MNANGQALDYREHYLGTKPLRVGERAFVGPQTLVWAILSGTAYDRRTSPRAADERHEVVAQKANDLMALLWETLPEIREARVSRWWKVLEATDGDSRRYVHDVMVTDEQVESCGDWVPAAATKGEG